MKDNNVSKVFYFHVPKTSGSALNKFFESKYKKSITHIESLPRFDSDFICSHDFVSGHMAFPAISSHLDLRNWHTLITFREPYSFVVSHISWIRKLADVDQIIRFKQHPEIFQTIALKMKSYDFSQPEDIKSLIKWLDDIDFNYLHNTQTLYLDKNRDLQTALCNLGKINYVGITEDINTFAHILASKLGLEKSNLYKKNVNTRKYGFNLSDELSRKALFPLINKDLVIYEEAKGLYSKLKLQQFGKHYKPVEKNYSD